ncbi:MAG: hypothetical protein M3Y30_00090, partial [Gemmatimonadota bacterium]|nr:hypothetical protein [Gemmatimonadota bacterium]
MREQIAVTGLGVVTPIGIGAEAFEAALRCGQSGVGRITAFDCRDFDTQIAAEIAPTSLCVDDYVEPRKMVKHMSRATQFAVVAAALARRQSRLGIDDVDPERIGVCIGAGGMGPVDLDMLAGQADAII